MARIKSPEQVKRLDGRDCFMELLTSGLKWDKLCLNFLSYNKGAQKGERLSGAILMYLDIPKAEVFCQMVLSGKMAKLGAKAKADAAAKGYKYAPACWTILSGSSAKRAKRADGMAYSRQLKLTPGVKTDWVLSAESGPGKEGETGIIAPAYVGGKPECIIRIPLSQEDLEGLALSMQRIIQLWYEAKFIPAIEVEKQDVAFSAGTPAIQVAVDAMRIERVMLKIQDASFFLTDTRAMVLAHDITSSRIMKLAKDTREPAHEILGGGKSKSGKIICRRFAIASTEDGNYAISIQVGPGKLNDTGSIVPGWDTPAKESVAILTREEFLSLGYALDGLSQAWAKARYMELVRGPVEEAQESARKALEGLRQDEPKLPEPEEEEDTADDEEVEDLPL